MVGVLIPNNLDILFKKVDSFSDMIFRCWLSGGLCVVEKPPSLSKIPLFWLPE